jgi:50S ribosomal subunit-associated GTPase HflX
MKGMIKSKNSKGWGQAQIGTSSLVLIFTVLALVIFSTLSLSSARVDQQLAEKTAQYITAYYKADALGEETLRDINRRLEESEMFSGSNADYLERIRYIFEDKVDTVKGTLTYGIPMSEEQQLVVELKLLSLEEARQTDKNYTIQKWVVQNSQEYEIDDRIPVWNGEEL